MGSFYTHYSLPYLQNKANSKQGWIRFAASGPSEPKRQGFPRCRDWCYWCYCRRAKPKCATMRRPACQNHSLSALVSIARQPPLHAFLLLD
jgi:hypothetical protein